MEPQLPARVQSILNGQSAIAKKVYAAVPIKERWPVNQIITTLSLANVRTDKRIIEGCLNTLVESGLVSESPRGMFMRKAFGKYVGESLKSDKPEETMATEPTITLKQQGPLEKLAAISVELKGLAIRLDDIALEVEEALNKKDAEVSKVRQVAEILKSL